MKVLWAPWRLRYIEEARTPQECIFCEKATEKRDFENFVLQRGKTCFTIMNLFPYANGHLMVAPYKHAPEFANLTDIESLELLKSIGTWIKILKRELRPDGFNVGLNLGKVAGAGVEDHVHFHIVPRWLGDSNFMPVLGEVKIIPEHIETTYRKLKRALLEDTKSASYKPMRPRKIALRKRNRVSS